MSNWAELPKDLLILIAKRITLYEDFLDFSGVCRSWRSIAIKDHFKGSEKLPWLMLSDKDKPNERKFVSLRKGGIIRTINLPEARGKRCLESLGWLVTISEDGDMSLLHPFTRAQINLPHVTTFKYYHWYGMKNHLSFINKAVLSSSPQESKDYVLMVMYSGSLAFWRPGDKCWTHVEDDICSFCDIIFHKGLFYGVIDRGRVFAFDAWGSNPTWTYFFRHGPDEYSSGLNRPYIVESAGEILTIFLKIKQSICYTNKDDSRVGYRICGFNVFEADLSDAKECVEKTSLGNNTLFLGDNASISVDASRIPGIKANCIYYTDNLTGGNYIGIYDMEDGSSMPCYEGESSGLIFSLMWVNPSSS